jgi:Protein of unknown function, DUF547
MRYLLLGPLPFLVLVGCTAIKPLAVPERTLVGTPHPFSHADFDRVLHRFVTDQGQVDYTALKNDARDLERYYLLLSIYSPDSHPALFLTENSKLAYWLNAYNAAVIKTVLTHYPIFSVGDLKPPFPFFFLPSKSGFFLFQRVTFGGKTTNLYFLEHRVIRKRFTDPRVHFVLNCASGGCPRLPRQAFTAEHLDEQLDHETRRFLAEERNFVIDHEEKVVSLSSIFAWYESDFLTWLQRKFPGRSATLLDYVAPYVSVEKAEELQRAASYDVRFIPYDWRLNDQRGRA